MPGTPLSYGKVPARVGLGGGMPLVPVFMLGTGPDEGPAEYLLGLGELDADFAKAREGPAPSDC
jgi:hypothetical protein